MPASQSSRRVVPAGLLPGTGSTVPGKPSCQPRTEVFSCSCIGPNLDCRIVRSGVRLSPLPKADPCAEGETGGKKQYMLPRVDP